MHTDTGCNLHTIDGKNLEKGQCQRNYKISDRTHENFMYFTWTIFSILEVYTTNLVI